MSKKAFIIILSVGIASILFAIFWLSVFIFFDVFQGSQITFVGDKNASGGQFKSFSTSPYLLLLFPATLFLFGLHLLSQAFNKPKIAELFFGLSYLSLSLFFVVLINFSDIVLSLIVILFFTAGLFLTGRAIKNLININSK